LPAVLLLSTPAAAMLVDEGKLYWDKPVWEYLPWFRMYDPHASDLMTLRDLLTHRSGLPRYDFLRYAVPLGMRDSTVRVVDTQKRDDYASPPVTFQRIE
jgi:CubicO group peptidase (beta-lactamase class C family)